MKKRPAIPRLDGGPQTILLVEDVDRTALFYRETLRLEAKDGDGKRYVEFDAGDGGTLLIAQREGSIPPHDGQGPLHVAFATDDRDYGGWCARLSSLGIEIESETHWERGGRSVYFRDADQHLVELVTPGIWPNY